MKDRIKQIRKESNETQQIFADKLNVSKSTIEAIEYGRRDATDRTISDICRIYHINESWLRTGEGEKDAPVCAEEEIADVTNVMLRNLETANTFHNEIIKLVAMLEPEEIDALRLKLEQLFEATKKDTE